ILRAPSDTLSDVLKDLLTDEGKVSKPLMCYPLPGFMVLLAVASSAGVSSRFRELAVFRRFLLLLVEGLDRARRSISVKDTPEATVLATIFGDILWRRGTKNPDSPADVATIEIEERDPVLSMSAS